MAASRWETDQASNCRRRRRRTLLPGESLAASTDGSEVLGGKGNTNSKTLVSNPSRTFTVAHVQQAMQQQQKQQQKQQQLWLIIHGQVLNLTTFSKKHPGGQRVLQVLANGCDATDAFLAYHRPDMVNRLHMYAMGRIVDPENAKPAPVVVVEDTDTTITDESSASKPSTVDMDDESEELEAEEATAAELIKADDPVNHIKLPIDIVASTATNDADDNKKRIAAMSADFQALHQDFVREGLYVTSAWFYIQVFAWLICLWSTSVALAVYGTNAWVRSGAGGFLMGLFLQQVAFVGHDLGHTAVTHNWTHDQMLGLFWGPLSSGISLYWWKSSHNLHHVAPNSVDHDLNIQHAPLFAIDTVLYRWFCRKKQLTNEWTKAAVRFLLSHEDVTFFPFIFLLSRYNLYIRSFFYLIVAPNNNASNNSRFERIIDFLALVGFHLWTWAILRTLPSTYEQVAFMMVSHTIASVLNVQIVLSHFPMPVYRGRPIQLPMSADTAETEPDANAAPLNECWAQVQVGTALNVDCPPYMDWFYGGLQFQMEHHLWPRVPRHNLRRIQARSQAYCRKHGLAYHAAPFGPALWAVQQTMIQVARDFREGQTNADLMNKNKTPSFMDSLVMKAMTMDG